MLRVVMLGVITPLTFNANPKFSKKKKNSTLKGLKKTSLKKEPERKKVQQF
jgi:hypothetical protein